MLVNKEFPHFAFLPFLLFSIFLPFVKNQVVWLDNFAGFIKQIATLLGRHAISFNRVGRKEGWWREEEEESVWSGEWKWGAAVTITTSLQTAQWERERERERLMQEWMERENGRVPRVSTLRPSVLYWSRNTGDGKDADWGEESESRRRSHHFDQVDRYGKVET